MITSRYPSGPRLGYERAPITPDSSGFSFEKTEKSLALASALFPGEEWVLKEPNIWVAQSRLPEEYKEPGKWEREMSQVRILTGRGSVAYFLPERLVQGESGHKCADLVLDGVILEMKTTEGTRTTLGGEFRLAYKQGLALMKAHPDITEHSVFIRILSGLKPGSVKAKIAGELKNRPDQGSFICYFEHTGELYQWTYKELKAIIST
jgi:hypothetical protein